MKASSRILVAAGVAIGVAVALLRVHGSNKAESTSRDTGTAEIVNAPAVEHAVASDADSAVSRVSPQQTPPALPESQNPPSARLEDDPVFIGQVRLAEEYAASFKPGLYGEEPPPEFLYGFLEWKASKYFEPLRDALEYFDHLDEPTDAWSKEMESRLRTFFGVQPELSKARVSISCRESQCALQMTTVTTGEHAVTDETAHEATRKMMNRLAGETWYRENLVNTNPAGYGVKPVYHIIFTLERRSHDGEVNQPGAAISPNPGVG